MLDGGAWRALQENARRYFALRLVKPQKRVVSYVALVSDYRRPIDALNRILRRGGRGVLRFRPEPAVETPVPRAGIRSQTGMLR